MKYVLRDAQLVQKYARTLRGVFSIADLKNLLDETNLVQLHRRIRRLQSEGILERFVRGLYTTDEPDLGVLGMKLHEDSCVSLASALARHLMIGTVPSRTLFAVRPGRTRTYTGPVGSIAYAGIRKELMFGCEFIDGVRYATREKALLDVLYFYQKGHRFYFDIYSDVNIQRVNAAIVYDWLPAYHNPRFTTFVKAYLRDRVPGH